MSTSINASDVINSTLKAISPYADFAGEDNAAVIKSAIESLYQSACNDSTFEEYVKILLTLAYERTNNESRQFRIFKHRDVIKLFIVGSDVYDQDPILTFKYGYVFHRERLTWHRHFMNGARHAASRTNCRSGRAVGVQIVRGNIPLFSSYNGVPAGYPHPKTCLRFERGCPTGEGLDLCPCNHAEQNAIGMAARLGIAIGGADVYVTSRPCPLCIAALTIVKPARIVFDDAYANDELVDVIANKGDLEIIHIKELD